MRAHIVLIGEVAAYVDLERSFLSRLDVSISVAPSEPQAALRVLRHSRPDLIVVEMAPGSSEGLLTCRTLRDATGAPVVAVVPRARESDALSWGADSVVVKPIARAEFLAVVGRHVPLAVRRHERIPANLRFSWLWKGGAGQAFSHDLSTGGVFLKCDASMPVGTSLELRFRLPGEDAPIACRGVVTRRRETGVLPRGFSVEFMDLSSADGDRLERFVTRAGAAGVGARS